MFKLTRLAADHYVVTVDEPIKPKDLVLHYIDEKTPAGTELFKCVSVDETENGVHSDDTRNITKYCQKVIGSTKKTDGVPNVDLLNAIEVYHDISITDKAKTFIFNKSKTQLNSPALFIGFLEGYVQCMVDNQHKKYTDDNMNTLFIEAIVNKNTKLTKVIISFDPIKQKKVLFQDNILLA